MAVAQHTEWEKKQLESIQLLLKQAIQAIDYFVEKNESLRDANSDKDVDRSADWLKFRGIMLDLYSVLDYVWYLLYCHFSNKGQPDFSDKGCELGFPYKKRGIRSSEKPEHDQKRKFVKEKLKMIWGDRIGEETHFWKEIGATIVSVQPKMIVDNSGTPQTGKAEVQPGVEESLALLHYYRNCAAHKDLITFMPKESLIEINQTTRVIQLVTSTEKKGGCLYMKLDRPGFWIQLPSSTRETNRLLIDVLMQLQDFVVNTASQLLRSALLLPSAKSILEHHIIGCKLEMEPKQSGNQQEAIVTATINDRTTEKTAIKENLECAEEDACIKSLSEIGIVPKSPYSCFTSLHMCQLSPQVQNLERMPGRTYKELLDDWKKKLEAANMEVIMECNKHALVRSKPSGAVVYKLCSDVVDEPNTDEAREAVASKLINEAVRLGLIEVKDIGWPQNLCQTLIKGNKTCQMVLNEYKQKVNNSNMQVTITYDEPHQVEQSYYATKLSLTVIYRDSGDKVFHTSSSKQKGLGKKGSKEAAAQEVLTECQKKNIITIVN